jgi:hypothetical protein
VACTHGSAANNSSRSSSSETGSAWHPPGSARLVSSAQQPWLLDWLQRGPQAIQAAAAATAAAAAPQGQDGGVTSNTTTSSSSRNGNGRQVPVISPGPASSRRAASGSTCTNTPLVATHQRHIPAPGVDNPQDHLLWLLPPQPAEAAAAAPAVPVMVVPPHSVTVLESTMRRRGCCTALCAGPWQVALAVSWALLQLPLVTAAASTLVWRWAGLEVLPPEGPPQEDSCSSSSALTAAMAGERLVRRARCWGPPPGGRPQQVAVAGGGGGAGYGQPGCSG